jgi:ankyrin repeat protein
VLYVQGCPVDIMEHGTGDTPLIVACRQGWKGIVELCLEFGAKNDPHPQFGKTALQVCLPHSWRCR